MKLTLITMPTYDVVHAQLPTYEVDAEGHGLVAVQDEEELPVVLYLIILPTYAVDHAIPIHHCPPMKLIIPIAQLPTYEVDHAIPIHHCPPMQLIMPIYPPMKLMLRAMALWLSRLRRNSRWSCIVSSSSSMLTGMP